MSTTTIEMKEFFGMDEKAREKFFRVGGHIRGIVDNETSNRRKLNLIYLPVKKDLSDDDMRLEIMRIL